MSTVVLLLRHKWLIVEVCDSFKTESSFSVAASPDEKEKGKKTRNRITRTGNGIEVNLVLEKLDKQFVQING